MHNVCNPLFGSRQVQLRSTLKPITPFGGLVSLISFFDKTGLPEQIRAAMPFCYSSPNAIDPAQTLVAFLISVIAGARRLAHTDWLRADRALHALLGIKRFPGTDTVRNFFLRFSQGHIEAFWRPMWRWLLGLGWPVPAQGFSLDLDSTVLQRSGHQQGAARGYNPARPGRNSHNPLLAVLAEAPMVLHAWLRSGNTGTSRGVREFLCEAMTLLPQDWKLRMVRADSGFFDQGLLEFLEERSLPYIIVARLTKTIKARAACIKEWVQIDENYARGEMTLQLYEWSCPRRFIVIRERIREKKKALGRKLIDVPGYTFRVFVTNCQGDGADLWRDYNKRACVEQHIEELKNDLQVQGFCMQNFFATESAFLAVCFTFNLLSLYQHVAAPKERQNGFKRPGTLRTEVFLGGAVLGNRGRQPVLYIAESWGGLIKHKPLLEGVLRWSPLTSPKLHPEGAGADENGRSFGSRRLVA